MSLGRKILKGSVMLTASQGIGNATAFVRNAILARMLSRADFGINASLTMVIALLEFSSKMGIGQQVVQAKEGETEKFQATAQLFQFLVALVSAVLILVLSPLAARLFKLPEATWSFACLAAIPILKGFEHMDIYRRIRGLDYRPSAVSDVLPQVLITLAAWPLAAWLGDYRVLLYLWLAKALMSLVLTHVYADRKYAWKLDVPCLRRMCGFSLPLLLNGFILFFTQQGDQLLIGTFYSMSDLGAYSAASILTMTPGLMMMQVVASILMPALAGAQDDEHEFKARYAMAAQCVAFLGALGFGLLILGGEPFVVIAFGGKYRGCGMLLSLLSAGMMLRVLRQVPNVAAMARGDTRNNMISNLVRLVGLPFAFLAAASSSQIKYVVMAGIVGEIVALGVALGRLARAQGVGIALALRPFLCATGAMVAAGLLVLTGIQQVGWIPYLGATAAFLGLVILLCFSMFPDLRSQFGHLAQRWQVVRMLGIAPSLPVSPKTESK